MSSAAEQYDVIIGMLARLEKKVDKLEGKKQDVWVTKERTLELLDCKATKLQELVLAGKIQVNANPKKGRRLKYDLISINKYLDNPE